MRIERTTWRGCPGWRLAVQDAEATVLEHGGQMVSWCVAGVEQLFVSDLACLAPGQHLRGGMPVSFPQFDRCGPLPRHGFARLLPWQREAASNEQLRMVLRDDAQTRGAWPHAFELSQRIMLKGSRLCVQLEAVNTGGAPFAFTAALHTYLGCDDAAGAALHGLHGRRYRDNFSGAHCIDSEPVLRTTARLGRVYPDCQDTLRLALAERSVRVRQQGFEDVVVWNPHAAGSAALDDLIPDAWRQFLCVEAAQVLRPAIVPPGAIWRGSQLLAAAGA